ncbi:MAG: response regulator [Pseudomonadota bacterium]|nr:response regulator [Pseudomonadota bacterium]
MSNGPGSGRAALVADDNPAARAQITGMLEDLGFEVTAVVDGTEALSALNALSFDLAVIDFRMPGTSGADVIAQLGTERPPVIGVSSTGSTRAEWGDAVLAGWLVKPVDAASLAQLVDSALSRIDTTVPAIDLAHLNVFTDGNAALEKELAELFRVSAARYLGQMRDAADDKAWKDAAHSLKGSARGLGAAEVARVAAFAETLLGRAAHERRQTVLAELQDACERVHVFFERHLAGRT